MATAQFLASGPSLASTLIRSFTIYDDAPLLATRKSKENVSFSYRSYAETQLEAAQLAAGLAAEPLCVPRRSAIGIACDNRAEWIISDFACVLNDFVVVGLHKGTYMHSHVLLPTLIRCCSVGRRQGLINPS